MKRLEVVLSGEAEEDLAELAAYLTAAASASVALGYVRKVRGFCERLGGMPYRGTRQPDGSRVVGFERRVSVRFEVSDGKVKIASLRYAGRQFERGRE